MTTGLYIRIERDEKWLNLDITECTEKELSLFLARKEPEWLISVICALTRQIGELNEV